MPFCARWFRAGCRNYLRAEQFAPSAASTTPRTNCNQKPSPLRLTKKRAAIFSGFACARQQMRVTGPLKERYVAAQISHRHERAISRFVSVDGARLHLVLKGSGAPVVLLHGN